MDLKIHPNYQRVVEVAGASHRKNRSPYGITAADVVLGRLYSYAFRMHTIGAFHATRLALLARPPAGPLAMAHRAEAVEVLEALGDEAMLLIPHDYRAVLATFWRYHRGVEVVIEAIEHDRAESGDEEIARIGANFAASMERITTSNGIYLTQDTEPPVQASFLVPNLGIIIVPLVYGDYHSWNLAWLADKARDVPTHWHHEGVEIHLGYNPTHGMTVLGKSRARVEEGYAKAIPPGTAHGWINTSEDIHHVPFIFGSLKHGGWGVFLDVEASTEPPDSRPIVPRESKAFSGMIYLERAIAKAEARHGPWRTTLLPHTATARGESGGIELNLTRVGQSAYEYPLDEYRILSIVRGEGVASINGIEQTVRAHDHFGVPAGMQLVLSHRGSVPLVALDAVIRPAVSIRALQTEPDFAKMTPAEKAKWNLDRWKRILG